MDGKGGIMMYILKGGMNTGGHYDVEMKRWMEKDGIMMMQIKRTDG